MVSLSLALALLRTKQRAHSRRESLFLNEGFGTLDSETPDAAFNALESLRLSGRTIGVISHIEALTRRIPVRIDVKRTGVGTSTIHVGGRRFHDCGKMRIEGIKMGRMRSIIGLKYNPQS